MGAGDKARWEDLADLLDPPTVRLVGQAAQSLANGTNTALTYGAGSEEIDSHNLHDTTTNPSRILLGKAGVWDVYISTNLASNTTVSNMSHNIVKNGASYQPFVRNQPVAATSTTKGMTTTHALVESDGDDYVEHFATQTSGGAINTQNTGGVNCVFEAMWRRPPI